ncbi:MAG: flagellar hook assembly protein FlgD [Terriglobales bacterium]
MTTMPAATSNPTPGSTATPPPAKAANLGNGINGNDFMTLLVAQLKNQDPTNPMDPTQFVTQLVQFNSLEQLININQDLTPASTTTPPAGGVTPPTTGTAATPHA